MTGNAIITALGKYKEKQGAYPSSLTELKPQYFKEVPQPSLGLFNKQEYRYIMLNHGEKYSLGFPCIGWMTSTYDPKLIRWIKKD